MKVDDSPVSPSREERKDASLLSNSEKTFDDSSVQRLDCGDNCLNGIKWPPELPKKTSNNRKAGLALNGCRRFNPAFVTHGGRTLRVPARFIESDSDDGHSSPTKFHSRKLKRRSSNSSRPKNSKLCKNGRMKSLESNCSNSTKDCSRKKDIVSSKEINGERTDHELEKISSFSPSGIVEPLSKCSCSDTQVTESFCLERAVGEPCTRTESDSSVGSPKRRGRPPKHSPLFKKVSSVDNCSPHGNCVTSATKASLASPSTSKFGKKRKLSKGIRNLQDSCFSSSSDENESMVPTPKRRGRPPKNCSANCETKHKIFSSQNGVRKPWVRPVLRAVDKSSLLKASKEPLNHLVDSSEKVMSKVESQLISYRVNGCNLLLPSEDEQVVKPKARRGRPPKPKSEPSIGLERFESNAFQFTGVEDQSEGNGPSLKRKLKKLKLKKSDDKRPLGAVRLQNRAVSQHLKRKALDKARRSFKVRKQLTVSRNEFRVDSEIEQSSDVSHKRRRRNKADRILGMRKSLSGMYEYLIQWKDGTSSWAPSNELVDYELDFKCFLGHEYQELTVVNRLAYHAYWKDDLIQRHGDLSVKNRFSSGEGTTELYSTNTTAETPHSVEPEFSCRQHICKEVFVHRIDGCLHVTVNRASSKRRKINERIIDSLTLVIEDAATDETEFVVISGLGDDMFCGVNLNDITRQPCEEEPRNYRRDVDKVR